MSAAKQFALEAGIPVKKKADGTEYVTVSKATGLYLLGPHEPYFAPLLCSCCQRPYPHELSVHAKLRSEHPGTYTDFYDLPVRFAESGARWPWSLKLSRREEPSTERQT